MSETLQAALAAARREWAVFPVDGKLPRTQHGFKDATTDEEQIRKWWSLWPDAGVAVATGLVSGLWVLDIDGEDGLDELCALELDHGEIHETISALTGKGRHLYFRWNGHSIRNSTSKVAPSVDVRGEGGYVVAPPSPHPNGGIYRWANGGHPRDVDLAFAPDWLIALAVNPDPKPTEATGDGAIPAGTRNDTLASLAGTMQRRGMSPEAIRAALVEENLRRCDPPLDDDEVQKISDSVARYEPEETPEPHTLTDTGNASRLVDLHGERLHHIPQWGKWLVWTRKEGGWQLDYRDIHVRELAKDVGWKLKREAAEERDDEKGKKLFSFGLRSLSSQGISGMVDLARGIEGIPLDHEMLDRDPWLLGVENGTIDLRAGKLRKADPADLMRLQAPVTWDEDATAPRWERALSEWFHEPAVRAYVQRVAGASLVGAQKDHVFVIHYGHGRNGKGTFVRAIFRALGPYAVVIHLSLLVEQRYTQHDTVKADLFRSRLAVASETQRRVRLDEASVKNLTGGDRITARRMREDLWEFDPSHSLWLQTNYLPEIGGRDRGIWSRVRVVKWESTFEDEASDQDLDDTLANEAPGILRWLVEGCLMWQQEGLAEPESVIRETLAYRNAEDVFSRFATDVSLVFCKGVEIRAGELQDLLTTWAREEGIDPPSQDMTGWLRENGARQTRKYFTNKNANRSRARFWVGVGIDDENHRTAQVELAT